MNALARALIRAYQFFVSPVLGQNCRFHPTCSSYAHECFQEFSLLRALWYTLRRISRCHPWNPGGFDPIPSKEGQN